MAIKIYLAPSNQYANKYCIGNTNERDVCNSIADKLVKLIGGYEAEVKKGLNSQTIQEKAKEANKWGATVYLSIHTNAGGGVGTEVWYNPNKKGSKDFAQDIYDAVAPKSPGKDRGLKSSTEYLDVKCPNVPCCLCELAFHDNKTDAEWLLNEQDEIASALLQGVIAYTGMKKKAEKKPEEKEENTAPKAGDAVALNNTPLYATSTTKTAAGSLTGTYYLWDGRNFSGRYRVTNAKSRVGVAGQVTGWIDASYVKSSTKVTATKKEKTHTVKKGESWWSIAAKEMGSGLKFYALAKYNGKTIFSVIHAGDVLKIPS